MPAVVIKSNSVGHSPGAFYNRHQSIGTNRIGVRIAEHAIANPLTEPWISGALAVMRKIKTR
ncbi:hypothetical protein [Thermobacillus sp.]|uniref:hypothetical protein n=1 Tax=Thermobacillus sp. TaxID=2108467 RepID=UPI00257DDBE2|nr:hypothetical protein [Thermobacillus sp.]